MWCLPSILKYGQGKIPAFDMCFIDLWNLLIPALLGGGGFITWDDLCKVICNSCSDLVRRLSHFRVRQCSQGFSACPFWWHFLILFYQLCKNFPLNFCSFLKELQKESVIIVIFLFIKRNKTNSRGVWWPRKWAFQISCCRECKWLRASAAPFCIHSCVRARVSSPRAAFYREIKEIYKT